MKKVKFREWQKAKASPEEEMKLKEYVEARKEAKKAVARLSRRKGKGLEKDWIQKKDKDLYIE